MRNMAVHHLDRKTRLSIDRFNAGVDNVLAGRAGKNHINAKLFEKSCKQRQKLPIAQGKRNADRCCIFCVFFFAVLLSPHIQTAFSFDIQMHRIADLSLLSFLS